MLSPKSQKRDDSNNDDNESATNMTGRGGDLADADLSSLLVNVRGSELASGGSAGGTGGGRRGESAALAAVTTITGSGGYEGGGEVTGQRRSAR